MKKLIFAGAALVAFAAPALSADLAPRYAKAPAMVVSDWSGFYVGAGVGGRWDDSSWTTTAAFAPGGFGAIPFSTDPNASFSNSSVRGTVYAGYNWQLSPMWVGGIEGDLGYAETRGTEGSRIPGLGVLNGGSFVQVKGTWDASVRLRAGYLISPSLLAYATGGVAFQHVEATATCPADTTVCNPAFGTQSFTSKDNRVGWTVGGGLEGKLAGNWLVRGEYRYSDFGRYSYVAIPSTFTTLGANADLETKTHTFTVGLAYKFGGPVVARY